MPPNAMAADAIPAAIPVAAVPAVAVVPADATPAAVTAVNAKDEDNNDIVVEVVPDNKGVLHFKFDLDGKINYTGEHGGRHHYMFRTRAGPTHPCKEWNFNVNSNDHHNIHSLYNSYNLFNDMSHWRPPQQRHRYHRRSPVLRRLVFVRCPRYSVWKMQPYWRVRL